MSLSPFPGFEALPGCHCVTSSIRKLCHFHGYEISEEMLLGLGAGVGFIYWHSKGQPPFLGGRGNNDNFYQDLTRRTGIVIHEHKTDSPRVAERELLRLLEAGEPALIYADMPYLSYLELPEDAHFGGHAVVVAGYDPAARQVLISDMAARETGYKRGTLNPLSMEQLAIARSSTYQPFPPHNAWVTFDFSAAHPVTAADAREAVAQNVQAMLHPVIRNLGVEGIRTAAKRAATWAQKLDPQMLRLTLFNVYIYTEIGGSGGGLFRAMYARFLDQVAALTGDPRYADAGCAMQTCADRWSALARPLEAAWDGPEPEAMLPGLVEGLEEVAALEDQTWRMLDGISLP